MYAEVPEKNVDNFLDRIEEGKIYDIRKFLVFPRRFSFRAVEGHSMIKFTRYTEVVERTGMEAEFPFCTYALTPIAQLPRPTDRPERFTDVLGTITGVSEAVQYVTASRPDPSTKRIIHLQDLTGHQISVVLWGEAALAFDAEEVLELSKTEPVVVILVGTLIKTYDGHRGLSGSAACRWYINEDLPDIRDFLSRLRGNSVPIKHIHLPMHKLI